MLLVSTMGLVRQRGDFYRRNVALARHDAKGTMAPRARQSRSVDADRARQPRLTAAPSRASACLKSSSAMSGKLAASRATAAGSLVFTGLRVARRSGAWRSAMRAMARQPRNWLTRSQITLVECWISIAAGPSTAEHQGAGFALLAVGRALPLDFDRLAARGNVGADDLGPARHQFGRGKALLAKGLAHGLADEVAQRLGEGAGGLVHDAVLCHPSAGTLR